MIVMIYDYNSEIKFKFSLGWKIRIDIPEGVVSMAVFASSLIEIVDFDFTVVVTDDSDAKNQNWYEY